ncbi:galactose oxidase [Fomitiporia mediterranea MF3/22]|uniref:galactose oxidase n=1 Tax=Fomitiporia mediterranea (strain MF3/22) TaxID=694068 RepID=UPI00044072E3|nr:galactose oxidase [Fomitiporia mediterranea MF3/22]EJD07185.1 galactose oxidase [Fomitiporia mediterranea MF3/22]
MAKKKAAETGKAAAKAAKKAKAAQKIERKEVKKAGKSKKDGAAADEDDLEAILENMRKEWEETHAVTEEVVEGPPSRRANATLTACPSGNYLWCIGGEYFSDDGKAYFYNDVYRYTPEKNEWRKFVSRVCPGPRSAHAVIASPAAGGKLFLFGGEFSSLYQNSFHHYRDFWCFDVGTHSWDRIDTKIRPSARSGCRMAMWKHYIFLFGGFYDPGVRTNYLDDLWYFDTQEYHWKQIEFREGDRKPSPRSGFSFLPTAEGIVLYGGYCKEYAKGKRPVGIMLDDAWILKITPIEANESLSALPQKSSSKSTSTKGPAHLFTVKWERRKKMGYAPGRRVGCTMAMWATRSMGILFGGVTDEDTNEETLESVYHNDLFGYQLTGNGRWVSLTLRKPKKTGKNKSGSKKVSKLTARVLETRQDEDENEEEDSDGEKDKLNDEDRRDGVDMDNNKQMATSDKLKNLQNTADVDTDPDDPLLTVPRGRYNAMLTVLRNILYIYGGILEMGPREYTLDDFYALPLDRLDRFTCLKPCGFELPKEGDVLESSGDSDEDEDGEDEDTVDGEESEDEIGDGRDDEQVDPASKGLAGVVSDVEHVATRKSKVKPQKQVEVDRLENDVDDAEPESDLRNRSRALFGTDSVAAAARSAEDVMSTPRPGETLAMFYARSREYWAGKAHSSSDNRGKLLRRDGFTLAQERYVEYKPVLEEVENILAEAGLDEDEIKRGAVAGPKAAQSESRNRR